jgi:chromosome transmission fidelity protein 4
LKIPLSNKPDSADLFGENVVANPLEEQFVRESVLLSLQQDSVGARILDANERRSMSQRENNIDRALLQLLVAECKDEDHGAKALEICGLFRQKRTLDLAVKAAVKFGQAVLAQKIGELRDAMDVDEE